ncbi:FAD-dependent oxidoreductase [Ferroplasma sp.]|uniref:FAD-dependent oxidoreductase n=1 Tax=Ferroplasma sp. TaxID=2591003 RepID=UPI00307D469B
MNIIVIGGGAAGMSAASKARRMDKNASITVFEKTEFVSYAECGMPYYLSGYFDNMEDLLHYPLSEFTENRNINVITRTSVTLIDRNKKYVVAGDKTYYYDKLVITTGASPRVPEILKGHVLTLRNMDDVRIIKQRISDLKNITIAGAGVLGTELFSLLGNKYSVKLISKHEYVLPHLDKDMGNVLTTILSDNQKDIEYNSVPLSISGNYGNYSVTTGKGTFNTEAIIFAAGIMPSVELAEKAGIGLTADKLIKVNDYLQTSDPDIYAAGDNVATKNIVTGNYGYFPLAQIANKMGRTIGINLFGNKRIFPGALGTTIINVLEYQVGYTGVNEADAIKSRIDYGSIFIKAKSKSNYLHGSDIFLKLIYRKETEEIIGGQIIGKDNAAWRLNVIATAISAHMKLYDLMYDDLGYEPEYGPVWDPIIVSASIGLDKTDNKK